MKRIYFCFLFAISFINTGFTQQASDPRISFFLSMSFENTHSLFSGSSRYDFEMNPNYTAGVEIIVINKSSFDKYGFGINYQAKNNLIGVEGNYNFWPLYFFSQIKIAEIDRFKINAQFNLGYNFFNANADYKDSVGSTKGGIYYSLGSVIYVGRSIQLRAFYSTNYGNLKIESNEFLVKNNFISLGLGYTF